MDAGMPEACTSVKRDTEIDLLRSKKDLVKFRIPAGRDTRSGLQGP
jgi:hypothetical protein